MLDAIKRNTVLMAGIVLAAGTCALAAPFLAGLRGATGPTVLGARSVVSAVMAVVLMMAIATGIACVVGRVINTAVGLFVLGTGLYALAGRLTTVEELIWIGGLETLPFETLLWGALVLGSVLVVFRVAGPLTDIHEPPKGREPHWLVSRDAMVSAAAGVAVLVVVWLFARSPMRGQTIGAVFTGAMLAGMAGRLLSPSVQPKLLFVAPCVFGAAGQGLGLFLMRGTPESAFVDGRLPAFMLPIPIDYAAAGLMGVAVGLGWARSFLHHEEDAAVASPSPRT